MYFNYVYDSDYYDKSVFLYTGHLGMSDNIMCIYIYINIHCIIIMVLRNIILSDIAHLHVKTSTYLSHKKSV